MPFHALHSADRSMLGCVVASLSLGSCSESLRQGRVRSEPGGTSFERRKLSASRHHGYGGSSTVLPGCQGAAECWCS
jgi:hypothetical protein